MSASNNRTVRIVEADDSDYKSDNAQTEVRSPAYSRSPTPYVHHSPPPISLSAINPNAPTTQPDYASMLLETALNDELWEPIDSSSDPTYIPSETTTVDGRHQQSDASSGYISFTSVEEGWISPPPGWLLPPREERRAQFDLDNLTYLRYDRQRNQYEYNFSNARRRGLRSLETLASNVNDLIDNPAYIPQVNSNAELLASVELFCLFGRCILERVSRRQRR